MLNLLRYIQSYPSAIHLNFEIIEVLYIVCSWVCKCGVINILGILKIGC